MVDATGAALPDGAFFMLKDHRDDFNLLSGRATKVPETDDEVTDQHDPMPERSKELSLARLQRLAELDPGHDVTHWLPTLFDDRRFPFDDRLLSPGSFFYGHPPQHPIHYDRLIDFAVEPRVMPDGSHVERYDAYDIVSEEWRAAIEALEPDTHEFFPHPIEFCQFSLDEKYIFRDRLVEDFIDLEQSGPNASYRIDSGEFAGRLVMASEPEGLAIKRRVVTGRHWLRQLHHTFVSRALATRLLPILPIGLLCPFPAISFVPVTIVD